MHFRDFLWSIPFVQRCGLGSVTITYVSENVFYQFPLCNVVALVPWLSHTFPRICFINSLCASLCLKDSQMRDESFSCLCVAGNEGTFSNETHQLSEEISYRLCHCQSVDLLNTTLAQKGLINQLPGYVVGTEARLQ